MRALGIGQRLDAHRHGDSGYSNGRDLIPRQVLGRMATQDGASRHDDAALDDILQFSDITRPVMVFQSRHHVIGDSVDHLALPFGERLNKVLCQQGDILSPFTQRWKHHRKHVQPVIEIGAELPLLNHASQVLVRGCNHPHVDLKCMSTAQTLELLLLESAQKLRLEFKRKVSNFIEKQCSVVCDLKASD
jgi:hypothetical protein